MKGKSYGSSSYSSYGSYGSSSSKKVDTKLISEDFKKYEDKATKKIKEEGMEKMGVTLQIDIYTDMFITYFLYRCQSKNYGEITQEEYTKGLTSFSANNLSEVKPYVIQIKEDLLNIHSDDFKKFYYFLFTFNLEKKTNKVLGYEVYKLFFNELFSNQFKLVSEFMEFMEKEKASAQIKEDQWNLFLELLKVIGDMFPKNYNVEESWPTLFDEFYLWYCKKYNIKPELPSYE